MTGNVKFGLELELRGNQVVVRGLQGVETSVQGLTGEVQQAASATNNLSQSNEQLTRTFTDVRSIIATLGVGYLLREYLQVADQAAVIDQRIRTATRSTGDYVAVSEELLAITLDNGAALSDTVAQFQQFARSKEALRATNDEMLIFTDTVQKLGIIGGATNQDMANGIRQLGQALGQPKVQAEELNSILDSMPELAVRIEQGLGLLPGTLKRAVQEGQVLSRDIFRTVLAQAKEIQAEFGDIPITLERGMSNLQTGLVRAIGLVEQQTGGVLNLAEGINDIGLALTQIDPGTIEAVVDAAVVGGALIVARFAGPLVAAYGAAAAAQISYTAAVLRGNAVTLGSVQAEQQRTAATLAGAQAKAASTAAEVANWQAVLRSVQAEIQLEQVRLRAQITEIGRQQSLQRSVALSQQLAATKRALAAAEAANTAATATATVAETAHARALAAATVASVAKGAASRGLATVMRILGGPTGVIMLAVGALAYFVTRTNESTSSINAHKEALDRIDYEDVINGTARYREELEKLDQARASALRWDYEEEVRTQEAAIASLEQQLERHANALVRAADNRQQALDARNPPNVEADILAEIAELENRLLAEQDQLTSRLADAKDELAEAQQRLADVTAIATGETVKQADAQTNLRNPLEGTTTAIAEQTGWLLREIEATKQGEGALASLNRERYITEELAKRMADGASEDQVDALRAEIAAHYDATVALKATQESMQDSARAAEELRRATDSLLDSLFPVPAAQREIAEQMLLIEQALIDGRIGTDEYVEGLNRLERQLQETVEPHRSLVASIQEETQSLQEELVATLAGEDALRAYNREKAIETELRRINVEQLAPEEIALLREEIAANYDAAAALADHQENARQAEQAQRSYNQTMQNFVTEIVGAFVDGADSIGDAFSDLWSRLKREFINSGVASVLGFQSPSTPILSGLGALGASAPAAAATPGATSLLSLGGLISGAGNLGATSMIKLAQLVGASNPIGQGILNSYGEFAKLGGQFGLSGGTSVVAGGLANAGIGYVGGRAGTALGESLFGKQAESSVGSILGGLVGTVGGPLGTLIGSAIGGVLDAAFGGDGKKRVTLGVETDPNAAAGGRGLTDYQVRGASGLLFTGRQTRADDDSANALVNAMALLDNSLFGLVETLTGERVNLAGRGLAGSSSQAGLATQDSGANTFFGSAAFNSLDPTALRGASRSFVLAWQEAVNAELGTDLDFAGLLDLAQDGEDAGDALVRVAAQFQTVNAVLKDLGLTLIDNNVAGIETTDGLVQAFGGLEQFGSAARDFAGAFISDAERMEGVSELLQQQFDALGVKLPATRSGFADLVRGLDLTTGAGQNAFAALTSSSRLMDEYYTALEQRGDQLAQQQSRLQGLDAFADQVFTDLLGSDQARYDYLKAQADSLAQLLPSLSDVDAIGDVVAEITGLASRAYGLLDESGRRQQGQEFIEFTDSIRSTANAALEAAQQKQADASVQALKTGIADATAAMASELIAALRDAAGEFSVPAQVISNATERFARSIDRYGRGSELG